MNPAPDIVASLPALSDAPGVSVIVITRNEERNIRECLDSLVALDYPDYEIIVVDASTDSTPRIAEEYPAVRVLHSAAGFARQKNAGLAAARHDIVAFTDADCIVPPGWLGVAVSALREGRAAGVGGDAFPPPGTGFFGRCVAAVGHPAGGSVGFDANVDVTAPEGIEFIAGCNGVFRRAALQEVGGFSPAFERGGEDVDLSRRLRAAGYVLAYAPGAHLHHKPHVPFAAYARWNVGVGVTKYSLRRPSLARLVLAPSFPLWPALLAVGWVWLVVSRPAAGLVVLAVAWLAFLGFLYVGARPYPLLLRRRRQAGVPLPAALTVVSFLILVRQIAINVGEIGAWRAARRGPTL